MVQGIRRLKVLGLVSAFLSCVLLGATATSAETITFSFQQSAGYNSGGVTIRNDAPTTNQNGGSQPTQIIVGANGTLSGGGAFLLRGLFEYDLSEIADAFGSDPFAITGVNLKLTTFNTAGQGSSATFDLYLLQNNADFDEATVTWNNAPSAPGGSVGPLLSSATVSNLTALNTTVTFGDTAAFRDAVADALASDSETIRFLLRNRVESGSAFARFASDDFGTAANRPALNVAATAVPLPAAAWGGMALFGMIGSGRLLGRWRWRVSTPKR